MPVCSHLVMTMRPPELQHLTDRLEVALDARLETGPARDLASVVFAALRRPATAGDSMPQRLPVCDQFDRALDRVCSQGGSLAELGLALKSVDPVLSWERRPTATPGDGGFYDGHANATIVGPQGIERRDDVWIGVSLMAPHVTYPEHHHPPAEIYIALSPGAWRHGGSDWFTPGIGGLIYNVADTPHAMRAGPEPLLAIWCLWTGKSQVWPRTAPP